MAGNVGARAFDAAVVENAADADVAMGVGVERLQEIFAGGSGAINDGPSRQLALREAVPRKRRNKSAIGNQSDGQLAYHSANHAREKSGATFKKNSPVSNKPTVTVQPSSRRGNWRWAEDSAAML